MGAEHLNPDQFKLPTPNSRGNYRLKDFGITRLPDREMTSALQYHHVARKIGAQTETSLPTNTEFVTAEQSVVRPKRLEHHLTNPGASGEGSDDRSRPLVIRAEGKHWIRDGHHRVVAAKVRGDAEIPVRLIDGDNDQRLRDAHKQQFG
jgi:hypothetical protein